MSAFGSTILAMAVLQSGGACFPPRAGVGEFKTQWYCKQLAAADEGLFRAEHGYRFVLIPSFQPTRVVIARLEDGRPVVVGKLIGGAGGYEPKPLVRTTQRELQPEEWRLLEQRFRNAGIWEPPDEDRRLGVDGSQWVLEARVDDAYSFRDVWSPDTASFPQYRKACEYMLTLANLYPDEEG